MSETNTAAQDLDFRVGDNSRSLLVSIVERIERLEEEKAALGADIREVFSEAKGKGFDTKILRMAIRIRKMDAAERKEMEAVLDLYLTALEGRNGG